MTQSLEVAASVAVSAKVHKGSNNKNKDKLELVQHTAIHCYTLQYTATHCNTLQHTDEVHIGSNSKNKDKLELVQHTAIHCNTLQHTATHCNTLQHAATHRQSARRQQTQEQK